MESSFAALRKLQLEYFETVNEFMPEALIELEASGKPLYELCDIYNDSYPDSGICIAVGGKSKGTFEYRFDMLTAEISKFWHRTFSLVMDVLSGVDCMTLYDDVSFTADPKHQICGRGVYFDTILFGDPFFYSPETLPIYLEQVTLEEKRLFGVIGCLALIRISHYALAECTPPLCAVIPKGLRMLQKPGDYPDEKVGLKLTGDFYRDLFGLEPSDKEVSETVEEIRNIGDESFFKLAGQNRLLDRIARLDLLETPDVTRVTHGMRSDAIQRSKTKAMRTFYQTFATISQIFRNGVMSDYDSSISSSDRVISGELNWELHKWSLSHESALSADRLGVSMEGATLKVFERPEFNWIHNVTMDDLVRLRQDNLMEEMRSIFRVGRKEIKRASLDDFEDVIHRTQNNIDEAIAEYSIELEDHIARMKNKQRLSAGVFVATASLGIASLFFPPLSLFAVLGVTGSLVLGGKSVRDVVSDAISGKKTMKELRSRPVSILAGARNLDIANK